MSDLGVDAALHPVFLGSDGGIRRNDDGKHGKPGPNELEATFAKGILNHLFGSKVVEVKILGEQKMAGLRAELVPSPSKGTADLLRTFCADSVGGCCQENAYENSDFHSSVGVGNQLDRAGFRRRRVKGNNQGGL